MDMKKIWRGALIAAACAAGLWLFAAVLLPVLAPFLIGLAVAALVQKPVALLLRRTQLPRGLAAFLCVLVIFGGLFAGLFFLLRAVLTELSGFLRKLPEKDRTVFLLRYYYAGTKEDIARKTGLSSNQVKYILQKVRKQLADTLKKEGLQ